MPHSAARLEVEQPVATLDPTAHAVAVEARRGFTATRKSLSPWLFYDEPGSRLFEQITTLPEYYLTRAEREIFTTHATEILATLGCPASGFSDVGSHKLTIAELGAGTASKTGILLRALAALQPSVLYQPIDISPTALDEARIHLQASIPSLTVRPHAANYVTQPYRIDREPNTRILALYIGSSIGNFAPAEAHQILASLRSRLQPGDSVLLGTDLAPTTRVLKDTPGKSTVTLLAAYSDEQGITAAFNRNVLTRLNRELDANFDTTRFTHRALWNPIESRIEMHLESLAPQRVTIPANSAGPALHLNFFTGETIHTENSYKFTPTRITTLLTAAGFTPTRTFTDPQKLFACTLATAL